MIRNTLSGFVAGVLFLSACSKGAPSGFEPVKPVAGAQPGRAGPEKVRSLRLETGPYFSYALPEGWTVAEHGQFALVMMAKDHKALTVMVGNAGLMPGYPEAQFASERLAAIHPQALQLGPPSQARPLAGFQRAVRFEVQYQANGHPCQGVATVHSAVSYDSAAMVMTAALADSVQWPSYQSWLPAVAEQVSATNGAAFGRRGVMAQNLKNSQAYAEAARRYRDWSAETWNQVTQERGHSVDRQNEQFREALGGVQSYANPYDSNKPVQLPATHSNYWVNEHGDYLGTGDPGADPNVGSTEHWKRMDARP